MKKVIKVVISKIPYSKSIKQFIGEKVLARFPSQMDIIDVRKPPRVGLRCDNEELAVQICEKTRRTTWTRLDADFYRSYHMKRTLKSAGMVFDIKKINALLEYLSNCDIHSFYVEDANGKRIEEFVNNNEFNVVYDKYSKYVLDSSDWRFINKFLCFPFDEIYRFALRSISIGFKKIAVIRDTFLSEKIINDLSEIGVEAYSIEMTQLHDLVLEQDYEVVVSTDLRNRKLQLFTADGSGVYHLPFVRFMAFLDDGFDAYKYKPELDIINNLVPFWNQNGIKFIAIQNPDDYDIVSRYRHDPIYYKKVFHDLSNIDRFLSPLSCDDISSGQIAIRGNYLGYLDYNTKFRNHRAGERVTFGSCYDEKNDIYFFGPCMMYGMYSSDDQTIESFLQKSKLGLYYNMHNYCTPAEFANIRMHSMNLKAGDAVVLMVLETKLFEDAGIPVISIEECYRTDTEKRQKWWWDRPVHVNGSMNKIVSDYLEAKIIAIMETETGHRGKKTVSAARNINTSKLWLKYNRTFREWYDACCSIVGEPLNKMSNQSVGCIVMNCNPYTKGHDYLVKYAASKVDRLYLFVLEEDRSFFSFKDRINMVKKSTEKLENVIVLPSGKYVISSNTMPGYFEKEYLQNDILDPSYDLTVFCEAIAPLFHISIRFVGEEPTDKYTRQYNDWMRKVFPQYDIKFCEIKRYVVNDKPVSGTEVRKMYLDEKWFDLQELVPDTVLDYLKQIHEENDRDKLEK